MNCKCRVKTTKAPNTTEHHKAGAWPRLYDVSIYENTRALYSRRPLSTLSLRDYYKLSFYLLFRTSNTNYLTSTLSKVICCVLSMRSSLLFSGSLSMSVNLVYPTKKWPTFLLA